eukprot:scpid53623/ scgid4225/ Hepatocyte growth factor receptor; HGF/SF receptor; Proto-oncogene c-Met; Scatter factor receptor; Tyrosine-protein kinase Met
MSTTSLGYVRPTPGSAAISVLSQERKKFAPARVGLPWQRHIIFSLLSLAVTMSLVTGTVGSADWSASGVLPMPNGAVCPAAAAAEAGHILKTLTCRLGNPPASCQYNDSRNSSSKVNVSVTCQDGRHAGRDYCRSSTGQIVLIATVATVANVILMVTCFFMTRRKDDGRYSLRQPFSRRPATKPDDSADCRNSRQCRNLSTLWRSLYERWWVQDSQIEINRILVKGEFGYIARGRMTTNDFKTTDAVFKSPAGEPSPSGEVRFVETAMSHRYFTHSKLLSPLAICMYKGKMPLIAYPPCAQNNLLEYLLHTTHQPPNPATVAPQLEESLRSAEYISFALDICQALMYLKTQNFIHGDVAARNCVMTGTRQVKLADSTMSKGMYPGHYYQVQEGDGHTHAIAVRWAAYEVAFKREVKTFDSEKWAFAVTVWEIYNRGSFPYFSIALKEPRAHNLKDCLDKGLRLRESKTMPPDVYKLLMGCWQINAKYRPSWKCIVTVLSSTLSQQRSLTDSNSRDMSSDSPGFSPVLQRHPQPGASRGRFPAPVDSYTSSAHYRTDCRRSPVMAGFTNDAALAPVDTGTMRCAGTGRQSAHRPGNAPQQQQHYLHQQQQCSSSDYAAGDRTPADTTVEAEDYTPMADLQTDDDVSEHTAPSRIARHGSSCYARPVKKTRVACQSPTVKRANTPTRDQLVASGPYPEVQHIQQHQQQQ